MTKANLVEYVRTHGPSFFKHIKEENEKLIQSQQVHRDVVAHNLTRRTTNNEQRTMNDKLVNQREQRFLSIGIMVFVLLTIVCFFLFLFSIWIPREIALFSFLMGSINTLFFTFEKRYRKRKEK
jgi:hypothetical protein